MEETKNENIENTDAGVKAEKSEPKEKKARGKEKELLAKIEELTAEAAAKDDKYLRLAAE
jgi:molecular chaperone GrpE (heat shock protein)